MRLPRLFTDQRRRWFATLLVNGFLQGLLAVGSAWLVMQLFDRLGKADEKLPVLFLGLALGITANALLRRRERTDAERLGQHYVKSIRRRLFGRLLAANARELGNRRKGAVLLKFVGDLSALRRWVSLGVARLLVAGVSVAIALGMLAWMHWPFAVGVSFILIAAAAWILLKSAALRQAIADARRCQANLSANVSEKLGSVVTVQAFGQIARERRFMDRQSGRLMQASVEKAGKIGAMRAVIEIAAGASVVTIFALAYLVPPPNLTGGMIAAVISIIGFLTPPLKELGRVQEYWLAAQVARQNLEIVSRQVPKLRDRRKSEPMVLNNGHIRLDRISLGKALDRVTAEAAGGSRVAVMGPNGSGKSTLLGLIGRLFDPGRGQVLIDGQNIARVALSSVRDQVAYVGADVPLIRGSLRKNLCYGAGAVTPEHLRQVLSVCELDDLVARLPGGLEGRIVENGSNLSQGESVRVALARALLSEPGILLLDEADAHLDIQAVRALDRVISSFSGTLVMATHRRSALRVCDTFWYLSNGRLTERDRPADSLAGRDSVAPLRGTMHEQRMVVAG
jgi:ABC-type multidrug transport system fused ATPase/permease subunit